MNKQQLSKDYGVHFDSDDAAKAARDHENATSVGERYRYSASIGEIEPLVEILEGTQKKVHISKTVCCRVHSIKGIPARRIDVIVDEDYRLHDKVIVEISKKKGKYDGSVRDRICIRRYDPSIPSVISGVEIIVAWSKNSFRFMILDDEVIAFEHKSTPLRTDMNDYDPARIVSWHWNRYFTHLAWQEVRPLAEGFTIEEGETLSEANRRASRELYRLSKDLGWRKLTLREQKRYKLSSQWQREETLLKRRAELGYPVDGVSEYTHEISRGKNVCPYCKTVQYREERNEEGWLCCPNCGGI